MPVIGHALVGFGTALVSLSARHPPGRMESELRRDYWVLLVVVLAYLPDIAAQLLQTAGVSSVSRLTHSLGFALLSAPAVGWLMGRFRLARPAVATLVALVSVVLHIVLDLLQGTDRAALWPLSSRRFDLGFALIPSSLGGELVAVSLVVGAVLVVSHARGRDFTAIKVSVVPALCVALVLGLAVATHVLRDVRDRQLRLAKWLTEQRHAYTVALEVLDEAERWPSPAKPGRVDYLRAQCFDRLGDRPRAEHHYLQSYAADPSYFWLLADVALFYASGPEPVAVRRLAAAPYVGRLTQRYSRHPETAKVLGRLRALGAISEP